jgi:hypothetical protein
MRSLIMPQWFTVEYDDEWFRRGDDDDRNDEHIDRENEPIEHEEDELGGGQEDEGA